ncbi:hypothetical protein [Butyrivibrio sp. AC2005]|uniref:hypothetical protein n=1 Tax=Butyrivibrio sp. AC2005 TaxID=1280672 RepID=UPI0012DCA330|nr:hypothetical protein [Butyrivibrio sp. AC2005]
MRSKKKEIFVFTIIVILQLLIIMYWANAKQNYFIDELYSMGYVSSYTGNGDTAKYITTSDDFKFNEWVENSNYKKYLLLSDEESLFRMPFYKAIGKILTGRNYFGLLNIAESIYGYDHVSQVPALVLNVILLILTEILLIVLMNRLNIAKEIQFLSIAMFGFSSFVITHVEYIRFYMLVMMYFVLSLILLHNMWIETGMRKFIFEEICFLLIIYLMYKNSEFAIIYFGAISICFFAGLIFLKQKIKSIVYGVSIAISGIIAVIGTGKLDILLHPNDYISESESKVSASIALQLHSPSLDDIKDCLKWITELFRDGYFGSWIIVFACVIAVTVYIILKSKKEVKGISETIGKPVKPDWNKFGMNAYFICILLGATTIFTAFVAWSGLEKWRYYCLGFSMIVISLWYLVDRLIKKTAPENSVKGVYRIIAVCVLISAIIPFKARNIEYLYENDASMINEVNKYNTLDTVLVTRAYGDSSLNTKRHETYDCVNLMSSESNIYAVNLNDYSYDSVDFPEKDFVLWRSTKRDISAVINDLTEHGYVVESLGRDHCSEAYICRKE